jgi:DNA-directed RNA polymerase subunit E'/Rpb7
MQQGNNEPLGVGELAHIPRADPQILDDDSVANDHNNCWDSKKHGKMVNRKRQCQAEVFGVKAVVESNRRDVVGVSVRDRFLSKIEHTLN